MVKARLPALVNVLAQDPGYFPKPAHGPGVKGRHLAKEALELCVKLHPGVAKNARGLHGLLAP